MNPLCSLLKGREYNNEERVRRTLQSCASGLTAFPENLDSGAKFAAPSEPREITKQGNF